MNPLLILSASEMRTAEGAAIAEGVASAALMEAAGEQTAAVILRAFAKRPVTVVCGPGNNGGDGFVVARFLSEAGWAVRVGLVGERAALKGDAALMAGLVETNIEAFSPALLDGAGLIVDAIFGTGLARPIEGAAKAAIEAINAHPAPVLAVDLPSGVNADTGAVMGVAVEAARTVTFHAKKPAHFLFPGRAFSGAVDLVDIGISDAATAKANPRTMENHPMLWGAGFPRPGWAAHKYSRGAVMALSGGPLNTGAARLAARAALRIGAGAVTMLSPSDAAGVHAMHLTAIMLRVCDTPEQVTAHLADAARIRICAVAGPANGVGAPTREKTLAILKSNALAVLDADALTSFADDPKTLFDALRPDDVLTPHPGEFARLFPEETRLDGRLAAARAASVRAGCVVVLKGADTIIAAPDGRAIINANAPADLATAGSGDVLAGFIAGLKAQGMDGFGAAAAGVWMHGACGQVAGLGLIAEDLPDAIPQVLRQLFSPQQQQRAAEPGGNGSSAQQQ
ncbi:MAG: NAD(P)H-hydrate dehydratase [Parvularculaceae bacterium]